MNVGGIRLVEWQGRQVATGIWKSPVDGRVALRGVNFAGDDQADRTVHGGPDKAVYAYAREDYDYWRHAGMAIEVAMFGENLTTEGIDLSSSIVGERWTVGSAVLEVAQPRLPCYKLGIRFGRMDMLKRMLRSGRTGFYFAVTTEGEVGAGDIIEPLARAEEDLTVADVVDLYTVDAKNQELLRRATESSLPESWREYFRKRLWDPDA